MYRKALKLRVSLAVPSRNIMIIISPTTSQLAAVYVLASTYVM